LVAPGQAAPQWPPRTKPRRPTATAFAKSIEAEI
jgi:hypothetical protein